MFGRDLLTVDIEGGAIRALVARRRQILRWDKAVLPGEDLHDGVIHDADQAGKALAEVLERLAPTPRRVVVSMMGQRLISRVLSLPPLRSRLLDEAVRRTARREIPMPVAEMDLSWQVIGRNADHLLVYVLAVPREAVDRTVDVLRAAHVRPQVMDVKPLALARTAARSEAVIVHLEPASLGVIVVRDSIPVIIRNVPISAGTTSPEARMELLSQELYRTTKYYNETHKDRPLPPDTVVCTTGELFNSSELREQLAARSALPVELPKPPLPLPDGLPLPEYAVNVGLALREV